MNSWLDPGVRARPSGGFAPPQPRGGPRSGSGPGRTRARASPASGSRLLEAITRAGQAGARFGCDEGGDDDNERALYSTLPPSLGRPGPVQLGSSFFSESHFAADLYNDPRHRGSPLCAACREEEEEKKDEHVPERTCPGRREGFMLSSPAKTKSRREIRKASHTSTEPHRRLGWLAFPDARNRSGGPEPRRTAQRHVGSRFHVGEHVRGVT